MQNVSAQDRGEVSSKEMHQKVLDSIAFMQNRGQTLFNGKLDDTQIEQFCILDYEAKETLDNAISRFALSFRSIKKIQKVARTIADLEQSELIRKKDILEALSYRRR